MVHERYCFEMEFQMVRLWNRPESDFSYGLNWEKSTTVSHVATVGVLSGATFFPNFPATNIH